VEDRIGVGAARMELVPGTGAGVEMRHWLSWVRVFDSLKDMMAVYRGLGREKRICCEGWDTRH